MERIIDLRSDTVTRPTEAMRDAMRNAEVGDVVMGEDKTVLELEARSAKMFDKEAALFVASGTMANQIAVMSYCERGDQIIAHTRSHIYNLEVGGISATSGVQIRAVFAPSGLFDAAGIAEEFHRADIQRAPTRMLCLENTFNLNEGRVVPAERIDVMAAIAGEHGAKVFLDGARIFNAAVASGTPVARMCAKVDAVTFCLSKGLACPIGAILMGPGDFIERATRMRQRLGGGWRQAGILAAAGLVALREMIDRLVVDHVNARLLAEGLLKIGLGVDLGQVQTNIVRVDTSGIGLTAEQFGLETAKAGVKVKAIEKSAVRMVTHNDIRSEDVPIILEEVRQITARKN